MNSFNYKTIECDVRAPGLARNIGLQEAIGECVWFVDSDDWIINPEILQQALPPFKNPSCNMIQLKFVSNFFTIEHYSMVWQYIYRRKLLTNIKFSSEQNFEDNEFSQKALEANQETDIPYLKVPSYFYNYLRPGSQTSKLREKRKS